MAGRETLACRLRRQSSLSVAALLSTTFLFSTTTLAHNFPYNSAQILMPPACYDSACQESNIAYILSSSGDFLSLDFSKTVQSGKGFERVDGDVPFSGDDQAFSAVRTANDTVVVYSGDCGDLGKIWTWEDGRGWDESKLRDNDDQNRWGGPYFLGGSAGFSTTVAPEMDKPTIYNFGGMCGEPGEYTASWQSEANYSKTMMSLHWEDKGYNLHVPARTGPRGPKYGMAGFSLTALAPSLTNISGTVTQQTRLVVLGGHLENAFINMSSAAVWSLPAESWDYLDYIPPPGADEPTKLATKTKRIAEDRLDPRSGHTAVLSEDGNSVVVYGGWVGDVDNPALPQLAVLELSQAYSGWRWTVPDEQPDANGLYGHAAAMLPGNVMMVYGGWEMGGSTSTKVRKRADGDTKFLNLTSMEWSTSYTNPTPTEESTAAPDGGAASAKTKRLGLGLGLGLGLAFLLGLIGIIFLFWRARQKKKRESRDSAVAALAQDARHFLHDDEDGADQEDFFAAWGRGGRNWYAGGEDPYQSANRSLGYEGLRGARGGGPSMSEIPRRPAPARPHRGGYAPAQSHLGHMATSGHIHPIMEDAEEDEYEARNNLGHYGELLTPTSDAPSDPFITPSTARPPVLGSRARSSATPSPEAGPRRYDPDIEEWNNNEVDVVDALYSGRPGSRSGGLASPTRRGSHRSTGTSRHDDESGAGSNLSELSTRQSPTPRRTPLSGTMLSGTTAVDKPPGSSSSNSFQTAKSSFNALQTEGPSLLRSSTYDNSYDDDDQEPGSPSKSKPRRNWLGSLRRVFSTNGRDSPTSTTSGETSSQSTAGGAMLAMTEDSDARLVRLNGELLRRKKGRQDWDAATGGSGAGDETEWDVEKAVENRMVQVMFTVPRERLRVVNADEEEEQDATSMRRVSSKSAKILHADGAEASGSASEAGVRDYEQATPSSDDVFGDAPLSSRAKGKAPMRRTQAELLEEDIMRALSPASTSSRISRNRSVSPLSSPTGSATAMMPPREERVLLNVPSYASIQQPRRSSHETDYSGRTASPLHTAEAVRMERPKTRVLRMVDNIESANNSPQNSPTKGRHSPTK